MQNLRLSQRVDKDSSRVEHNAVSVDKKVVILRCVDPEPGGSRLLKNTG